MRLPSAVVAKVGAAQGFGQALAGDTADPIPIGGHRVGGLLQGVQGHPCVSAAGFGQGAKGLGLHLETPAAQPPFGVLQGPLQEIHQLLGLKGLQGEDPAA